MILESTWCMVSYKFTISKCWVKTFIFFFKKCDSTDYFANGSWEQQSNGHNLHVLAHPCSSSILSRCSWQYTGTILYIDKMYIVNSILSRCSMLTQLLLYVNETSLLVLIYYIRFQAVFSELTVAWSLNSLLYNWYPFEVIKINSF